jgi:BolA protein
MVFDRGLLARDLDNTRRERLGRLAQAQLVTSFVLAALHVRARLPAPPRRVDADIDELDAVAPHVVFRSGHGSYLGMGSLMPQELTSRIERMRAALDAAFSPTELDIVDESHLHHGHAGAAPGGETHYAVKVRSAAFQGLSRLAKHRAVNDVLKAEFEAGLHALHIDAA